MSMITTINKRAVNVQEEVRALGSPLRITAALSDNEQEIQELIETLLTLINNPTTAASNNVGLLSDNDDTNGGDVRKLLQGILAMHNVTLDDDNEEEETFTDYKDVREIMQSLLALQAGNKSPDGNENGTNFQELVKGFLDMQSFDEDTTNDDDDKDVVQIIDCLLGTKTWSETDDDESDGVAQDPSSPPHSTKDVWDETDACQLVEEQGPLLAALPPTSDTQTCPQRPSFLVFCDRLRARELAARARNIDAWSTVALNLWEQAANLLPCSEYANQVASLYLQNKNFTQATKWILRALSVDQSDSSRSFFLLGHVSGLSGDRASAVDFFQRAVAVDPLNADAQIALQTLQSDIANVVDTLSPFSMQLEGILPGLGTNEQLRLRSRYHKYRQDTLEKQDRKVERLYRVLSNELQSNRGLQWRLYLQKSTPATAEALGTTEVSAMVCSYVETKGRQGEGGEIESLSGSIFFGNFSGKLHAATKALAEIDDSDVVALQDSDLSELGRRKALLLASSVMEVERWKTAHLDDPLLEYPFINEVLEKVVDADEAHPEYAEVDSLVADIAMAREEPTARSSPLPVPVAEADLQVEASNGCCAIL